LSDKTGQTLTLHRYGTKQMWHISAIWRSHWRRCRYARTRGKKFTWRHNT